MKLVRHITLLTFVGILLSGCSPTLSPLFRDYNQASRHSAEVDFRQTVSTALSQAEWEVIDSELPLVVATAPRTFKRWGLYRVEVSLEVAPLSDEFVRVLVNPVRVYFTGTRSKIPYFRRSLQRAILKDLNVSFAAHGITALGAVIEEDSKEKTKP